MAEFCVKCWNELNDRDDPEEDYVLSWEPELCEGCGEWKRVIVDRRRSGLLRFFIGRVLRKKM